MSLSQVWRSNYVFEFLLNETRSYLSSACRLSIGSSSTSMEPFGILGVAASIITCVQLTGALLKRVGPSDHSKKDLNEILKAILGFKGAYENLEISLRLNEEDESRLLALQHLEAPLRHSKRVLDLLEKRLESPNFLGQYIVGVLWDAKLKRSLKELQDTKTLFEIALDADQQ